MAENVRRWVMSGIDGQEIVEGRAEDREIQLFAVQARKRESLIVPLSRSVLPAS
jgi:hypothetical protein